MKYMRYVLIGLGVVLLYWIWIAWFPSFFNGISQEGAITVGTGFFLSLELVVLTGVILEKFKSGK